jgi:hypothetical protein
MSNIEYNPSLNDKVNGQLGDLNVGIQIPLSSIKDLIMPYKVYTALLTQSGEDDILNINGDGGGDINDVVKGSTVVILANPNNTNYSSIGAPNSNEGTYFVLTQDIYYTDLDVDTIFEVNLGAPVVTALLENTIGNIWFEYGGIGQYYVKSSELFINGKTTQMIGAAAEGVNNGTFCDTVPNNTNQMYINSVYFDGSVFVGTNGQLFNTPIEIRVYN